jgi:hypothetical protein
VPESQVTEMSNPVFKEEDDMERVIHIGLLLVSVCWPVSLIATSVVVPPVGLIITAMILTFTLVSMRFFKNLFRKALDAYFSENA